MMYLVAFEVIRLSLGESMDLFVLFIFELVVAAVFLKDCHTEQRQEDNLVNFDLKLASKLINKK